MKVKTTISFLCLAFLLWGGCSKDEEALPPEQIVKVRKPIVSPLPEKVKISSLSQPDESERHAKQAQFEKKEGGVKDRGQRTEDRGQPPSQSYVVPRRSEGEASSKSLETQPAGAMAFKELKKIRFETTPGGEEKVLIWLNGRFPPHTFSLEGERPRVVCDFFDVRLGSNLGSSIKAGGRMIKEIRIAPYKDPKPKVRVVLDLVSRESGDYEVQPIFYKEENIFALVVK